MMKLFTLQNRILNYLATKEILTFEPGKPERLERELELFQSLGISYYEDIQKKSLITLSCAYS